MPQPEPQIVYDKSVRLITENLLTKAFIIIVTLRKAPLLIAVGYDELILHCVDP